MTNNSYNDVYTNRLREIRKSRNITQLALAENGGVSRQIHK